MPHKLPRGIFFEPHRNRFRVRLYYCQQVVWRSYHERLEDATAHLDRARQHRREFVRALGSQPARRLPTHLKDLLT